ncbi:MAG: hypothetical protein Q7J98_11685 [Kiritimatiellia bacterium]|nr:hypothetical protein [Kiritimatiellia bacterium]
MINLHINLLVKSEERSTSRISGKFLLKASAVFTGLLLLALVIIALVGARSAKQALFFAEQEKKQLKGIFQTVTELQRELVGLQELTNAVNAWAQTRPDWPALLSGMQSVVPINIQLTRLTANENIAIIDNMPARIVTLYLQGKAVGAHSETDVQELEKSLKEKSPFKEVMEFARVKQFEAAKNEGQGNIRIFDIECRFKAQKLFKPTKAKVPDAKK